MLEPLPMRRASLRPQDTLARNLSARVALDCLAAGWRDFRRNPLANLGVALFLLSVAAVWALWHFCLIYLVLPALAGA